jgi:NAD(P)H-dependent flavin oxidoreductase YrpB (nitropropane dioxygenase family)
MDTNLCRQLGITVPIIQAPMAGGWTTPELVSAVSDAGGLGVLAAGRLTAAELREQIAEVRRRTQRPFGVNFLIPTIPAADAGPDEPVFQSRKSAAERSSRHPRALSDRAVNQMLKRAAAKADINPDVSAHWLRHAHASHAIDKGATLAVVQATLGHSNVSTTGAYLHARPDTSSGLFLDEGVFLR